MKYYAQQEQEIRRFEVIRTTIKNLTCTFDENGYLTDGTLPHTLRLMLHVAMTYLWEGSTDKVACANRILHHYLKGEGFCHFSPFLCMQIFFRFQDRLDENAIREMDSYCLRWMDAETEPALEVIGCNDNYPFMAAGALLGAALRYKRKDYLEAAAIRMQQTKEMFERNGFTSEYTSNTYTPIQALCLAEIAEFAADPQRFAAGTFGEEEKNTLENIQRQALEAESLVHRDLLTHLHWETAQLGGACSRGYARDVAAATSHARFLYYMLYGKELLIDPTEGIMQKGTTDRISHNDDDFLRLMFAWHAMATYHCPAELADWAKHKKYPYIVIGTAESLNGRDLPPMDIAPAPSSLMPDYWEYPEHKNLVTTYMTADYCLGTARYGWLGGMQSHNLQLLYRKGKEVSMQRQVGAMFTRYVINDHEIFNDNKTYVNWEMGVCVTQQKENTAIALYSPRLLYDRDIRSLKLTVNFTDLYGEGLEEIWLGDRKLLMNEGGTAEDTCVYVQSGEVYICLKPLLQAQVDRNIRCEVRKVNKLIEISFINYRGAARDFSRMELGKITNGVAVEVRSRDEYADFSEFRKAMQPKTDDYMFTDSGRAVRKFRYENDGKILHNEYSPLSMMMRYAMENGKAVPEPRFYSSDYVTQ